MPSPTEAPPEAVKQLSELPEYELGPDGVVRPLQTQNQAAPSPQASQAGVEAEAVGSPVEQTTSPVPAQQPIVVGPPEAPGPVVQVIPPQPAQAPIPEPPQAQAPTAEPTPEEEAEAERKLDAFLEEQLQAKLDAALRERQSGFDKRAAQLDRQMQEASQREQAARQQIRELQTRDLTDEERAQVMAKFSQEDERTELDTYRAELVDYHKNLMVQSLTLEFSAYGVTQEAVEQFDSPEGMEAFCYEQKANYLEAQMEQARQAATAPPQATQIPVPAQPKPEEPAVQPQPQVPAGVHAPVDLGSGGTPGQGPEFNQEVSQEALRQNLKNMGWQTVRIGR